MQKSQKQYQQQQTSPSISSIDQLRQQRGYEEDVQDNLQQSRRTIQSRKNNSSTSASMIIPNASSSKTDNKRDKTPPPPLSQASQQITPQKPATPLNTQQRMAVNKILSPFKKYSHVNIIPTASSRTHRAKTPNGQVTINISPARKTAELSRSQFLISKVDEDKKQVKMPSPKNTRLGELALTGRPESQFNNLMKSLSSTIQSKQKQLDEFVALKEVKNRERAQLQREIQEYKKHIAYEQEEILKLMRSQTNFKEECLKISKGTDKRTVGKISLQQEDKTVGADIQQLENMIEHIKCQDADIQEQILLEQDIVKDLIEKTTKQKQQIFAIQKDKDKIRKDLLQRCKHMQRMENQLELQGSSNRRMIQVFQTNLLKPNNS